MHSRARRRVSTAGRSNVAAAELRIAELAANEEAEVLSFLSENVTRTFGMVGFIRNNGLQSPHNPGTFYDCRNEHGQLEGVALIGRFVLFETLHEAAAETFARIAQQYKLIGRYDTIFLH